MILAEQDDEWEDGRRYFRPETLAPIDAEADLEEVPPLLMASWAIRRRGRRGSTTPWA